MHATSFLEAGSQWDAAVVGAGPAGSIGALHLARKGLRVLLVDRTAFPRDKVCGDGLIEDTLRCLERANILNEVKAQARELSEGIVSSPSRVEVTIPGRYLTLKRFVFDDILRQTAVRAGACFVVATVTDIESRGRTGFTIRFENGSDQVASRVIIATGTNQTLLRRCNFRLRSSRGHAAALRCYVGSEAKFDKMLVSFDRSILPGYAWIFPLKDGEYNIGCGVFHSRGHTAGIDLNRVLRGFLEDFPEARRLMAEAHRRTKPKGAAIWSGLFGADPVSPAGILAVGEAIGTTFPFTGEGIGKAMESAELAAEAVAQYLGDGDPGALDNYREAVRNRLRPKYTSYLTAQKWLSKPWLNDMLCRRALKSSYYVNLLAGILNETVDPSEAFSVRGVLGSFFR